MLRPVILFIHEKVAPPFFNLTRNKDLLQKYTPELKQFPKIVTFNFAAPKSRPWKHAKIIIVPSKERTKKARHLSTTKMKNQRPQPPSCRSPKCAKHAVGKARQEKKGSSRGPTFGRARGFERKNRNNLARATTSLFMGQPRPAHARKVPQRGTPLRTYIQRYIRTYKYMYMRAISSEGGKTMARANTNEGDNSRGRGQASERG